MHVYIYDEYVSSKKYDKILAQIETRITDLGLNGKIIRLGIMKNINSAIENEIKLGAKTIVAVGNDKTINQVVNAMCSKINFEEINIVPLGIIPIGEKNNLIAEALGIKEGEAACDDISARRIEKINIAKAEINNLNKQISSYYFISNASINGKGATIKIQKNYSIEIMDPGQINIINLSVFKDLPKNMKPNPKDKILEIHIKTKKAKKITKLKPEQNHSFFSLKSLVIVSKDNSIILDNSIELKTPARISVSRKNITIIVGKNRNF